jgi:pimeloyl-ACP methyl ester carboxylesterase
MTAREYPVFIPLREEHLAAVFTLPRDEPRGLVLLLPGGGGAPRSHRFSMWTKAARALADRDIASVRMDWRGVGDSTGDARFGWNHLPVDDVVAMAGFAMNATGTAKLGIAGNCMGARTALKAAPNLPGLETAVLILVKPLARLRTRNPAMVRSKALLRRLPIAPLARRLYVRGLNRKALPLMDRIAAVAARSDVLLLESLASDKIGRLPQLVQDIRRNNGHHRVELRDLPGGEKRAFHRIERQEFVVRSVVEWFDRSFPRVPGTPPEAASRPSTVPAD